MRKLLMLPLLLAGCASQSSIAPVSTPQDWERWLQIGPNCRPYAQRFCLAGAEDAPTGTIILAAR
jgi:hypothetical protein